MERGTHAELLARGAYAMLYREQFADGRLSRGADASLDAVIAPS
ncbi:MAG: hypothetical protein R3C32_02855 [Chloroflexota bacterium]